MDPISVASAVIQFITLGNGVVSGLATLENEIRCLHSHDSDQRAQTKLHATEIRMSAMELHKKLTEKELIPLVRCQNLKDCLEQIKEALGKISDALLGGGNNHEPRQNRVFKSRHTSRQYMVLRSKIKAVSRRLDLALQGLKLDLNTSLLKTKNMGSGNHNFVNDFFWSQKTGECEMALESVSEAKNRPTHRENTQAFIVHVEPGNEIDRTSSSFHFVFKQFAPNSPSVECTAFASRREAPDCIPILMAYEYNPRCKTNAENTMTEELTSLAMWLQWRAADNDSSRSVLSGVGGIGKSQICPRADTVRTTDFSGFFSTEKSWYLIFDLLFPHSSLERHFAERAVYCVKSAFRPLRPCELFAAATTRISHNDPDWRTVASSSSDRDIQRLLSLCHRFLEIDPSGFVVLRDTWLGDTLAEENLYAELEARRFMAQVNLKHVESFDSRVILRPWHRFEELLDDESRYPLHKYALMFWSAHYIRAEAMVSDLPDRLRRIIESAWIAEKTQHFVDLHPGQPVELDLGVHAEALDVGLELCRAYGFEKLASTYLEMGAEDCDRDSYDDSNGKRDTSGPNYSCGHHVPQTSHNSGSEDNAFDFRSWHLVGPMDLE